jgi:hypothetical protein
MVTMEWDWLWIWFYLGCGFSLGFSPFFPKNPLPMLLLNLMGFWKSFVWGGNTGGSGVLSSQFLSGFGLRTKVFVWNVSGGTSEGSIRLPNRGERMGADKSSSPKRWNQLCPKIIATNSHMNLLRSHSHNWCTNPRNKSQLNPNRKHNTRSKGHGLSARLGADSPQGEGRWSAGTGRTVRKSTQTSRSSWGSSDGPREHRGRSEPHGQSDQLLPTKTKVVNRSKQKDTRIREEYDEQLGC